MHSSLRNGRLSVVQRRGVVMILVLVIVAVLSFAVYTFTQRTLLQYAAVRASLDQVHRRELAASGVELSDAMIRRPDADQALWSGPMTFETIADGVTSLTIVRDLPGPGQSPQFGLADESAKLNINALDLRISQRRQSRQRLLVLPGMTVQIADAILDWMDLDEEVSEFGAESNYYTSLRPPYRARQGRFTDLNELLLVKGVTSELLFGEDRNGNGLLDPNENDGANSKPTDDADGMLDKGWIGYITLVSRESISMPTGVPKINLNQPNLASLYDALLPGFGPEMARYVVTFRMRKATWADDVRPPEKPDEEQKRLERIETAQKRLRLQRNGSSTRRTTRSPRDQERDGIRLTSTPAYQFDSLVQLFGGQVRITIQNKDQFVASPWAADPGSLVRLLPLAEQILTTSDHTVLEGRINVNQASEEVLTSIPGLSPSRAHSIVRMQPKEQHSTGAAYESVAWLAARGVMPVAELRRIAPYLTVSGDVQGGIALGWLHDAPPVAGIRFMIDASGQQRRVLLHKDLAVLTQQQAGFTAAE